MPGGRLIAVVVASLQVALAAADARGNVSGFSGFRLVHRDAFAAVLATTGWSFENEIKLPQGTQAVYRCQEPQKSKEVDHIIDNIIESGSKLFHKFKKSKQRRP